MKALKTGGLLSATFAAAMFATTPSLAAQIVLSGPLDNLQVVAPVFQTDANGNQVLDQFGDPIVIDSTGLRADGVTPISTAYGAKGFATITIDTVAQTITTDFQWSGLSGTADRAHLHDAPPGTSRLEPPNDRFFHEVIIDQSDVNGDPILDGNGNPVVSVTGGYVACAGDPNNVFCAPATGSLHDVLYLDPSRYDPAGVFGFVDFDALLTAFITDGMFLDIHTDLYPGGEIRGQLRYRAVPVPGSLALLAIGLVGLRGVRGRLGRTRAA